MAMEPDARTDCSSYASAPGVSTLTKTSSFVKTGAAAATGAALAVGLTAVPIVGAIAGIVGLISGLFGAHHAHAVSGEQSDICNAVPQVNQALAQIDQGLASGQVTQSQAGGLYSQLATQFSSALHRGTTFKTGDALWAFNLALTGILQARNQDLQHGVLTGGGAAPWAQPAAVAGAAKAAAQLGIPLWALLLGAGAVAYALL